MMDLEKYTPEEQEIFKRQIESWKDEYYGAVYVTQIEDYEFIWRGLTKAEFKKANEYYEDLYDRAEYVSRICVLFPEIEDWGVDMFAGIPETLAENILRESGFTLSSQEIDRKMAQYEQQMQTFDNQIVCVIKEAFPDIQLDEIEYWQFDKILWYYARAKWTLETLRGVSLEREEVK
jgi:hypothetical protein